MRALRFLWLPMKIHPALWIPIVLWGSLVQARTYVVNSDGTGDFPSIQAAINAAAAGDTVALSDGVFMGDGNRDVTFLGKALVLRSQSGNPAGCVVDAQGSANDQHRVFAFMNGEGPGTVLDGITIRGGCLVTWDRTGPRDSRSRPPDGRPTGARDCGAGSGPTRSVSGGGLFCAANAGPTIRNCVITGNKAEKGSGLGVAPGARGNICADPLFCDPDSSELYISRESPCARPNTGCDVIGAWGVGCERPVAAVAGRPTPSGLLLAASPNPFDKCAEISVFVRSGGPTAIPAVEVYDLGGRLVRTLYPAPSAPGPAGGLDQTNRGFLRAWNRARDP